jgi:hypothetical protein
VKFEGENTKYYHAKARSIFNSISEIKNEFGETLAYHHDNADTLWKFCKNKMVISIVGTAQAHINHIFP